MKDNCSRERCPFNFKECYMNGECPFYTKRVTNGDMIQTMLRMLMKDTDERVRLEVSQGYGPGINIISIEATDSWWNTPYTGGIYGSNN